MKLVWSPLALERMGEIADFIAQERPQVAEEWVEEVFAAVENLVCFPGSGRVVPEVRREQIREMIHGNFRIIYRLDPAQVSILTVRHARQLTGPEDIPG